MKTRLSETFDLGSKGSNGPNTDPTPPPARLLLGLEHQEMIQNDLKLQLSLLGVSFAQCKYFIPDQWMNSFGVFCLYSRLYKLCLSFYSRVPLNHQRRLNGWRTFPLMSLVVKKAKKTNDCQFIRLFFFFLIRRKSESFFLMQRETHGCCVFSAFSFTFFFQTLLLNSCCLFFCGTYNNTF